MKLLKRCKPKIPKVKMGGFSFADIPDMSGKTVLITGANVGLGYITALECARKGATVILACRSQDRAQVAIDKITALVPNAKLEFLRLDLQDLQQVKNAAETWMSKGEPLHVLCNNAGIMAPPFGKTKDGIETQWGTNHIGHFVLTHFLLPRLIECQPSRIVNLSSFGHNFAPSEGIPSTTTINDPAKLDIWTRYGISKLSNILFTVSLAYKLKDEKVYVNACHPGFVATELMRGPTAAYGSIMGVMNWFYELVVTVKPETGALTQIYLATSPDVETKNLRGKYFVPTAKIGEPSKHGRNAELATKLWTQSVEVAAGAGIVIA
ncbi:hypothetical protein SmJEL517_g06226 [Synchytrium microbalum]|uniref:Uncharacterized protein n=1 Tax=Synchytrium microbalum TaxID=1806994 RepID=A0A507BWB9_9FUNG|nr:uncharacterized protein SmJEL517_g06226 [Synchytrium microbalum]TPX30144.1 hypothetical protein SmJEL517_g06226 [Synchytrium microbalum]